MLKIVALWLATQVVTRVVGQMPDAAVSHAQAGTDARD
jgi:hypothetical protein